jgi:hypothetical protein
MDFKNVAARGQDGVARRTVRTLGVGVKKEMM